MGFEEDMAAFDEARLRESRQSNEALQINARNASKVVSEIDATLGKAVDYVSRRLPDGAGYIVSHAPPIQGREKSGWFGSAVPAQKYPCPVLTGRFWWASHPWYMLTDDKRLLYNWGAQRHVLGGGSQVLDRDEAEAARKAGVPEGREYTLVPGGQGLRPVASQLLIATNFGWEGALAMGVPMWTTYDRQPYAGLLNNGFGNGFGITPLGTPGMVDVQERGSGADANPFRITMYDFGKWIGRGIQDAIRT